jgi:hypothetical protein
VWAGARGSAPAAHRVSAIVAHGCLGRGRRECGGRSIEQNAQVALAVGATHARPDRRQSLQRRAVRVAERIADACADERHGRPPRIERLRDGAVRTSVVRHLQHVDALSERLENPALSALLGVAEHQRALAPPLDEQDDARVVGFEPALAASRP